MQNRRRGIKTLLVLFAVLAVIWGVPADASAAKLSSYNMSVYVGNSATLTVSGAKVKSWSSSKTTVATVNKKGVVRGIKKGRCKIYANLKNGKTLTCTMNVRSNTYSTYLSNTQAKVMLNILGAVETGGQVYGRRDYTDFTSPFTGSPYEYSSTAGAYQEYGENLRQLLIQIKKDYPYYFKKHDTAGITKDLKRSWSNSTPYAVYKGSKKAKVITKLISGAAGPRLVQDLRAYSLIDSYLKHIRSLGVTNVRAALFMAECEHLGGASSVERIIRRSSNINKISALKKSLYKDQQDRTSSYQIGDRVYQSRHELCYKWIIENIPASAKLKK